MSAAANVAAMTASQPAKIVLYHYTVCDVCDGVYVQLATWLVKNTEFKQIYAYYSGVKASEEFLVLTPSSAMTQTLIANSLRNVFLTIVSRL